MAEKSQEAPRAGRAPAAAAEPAAGKPAPAAAGGKLMSWLPLIVTVVAMPALAFLTVKFLILPKLEADLGVTPQSVPSATGGTNGTGTSAQGSAKYNVPFNKIVVNVAGTLGTRYLMASFTLVGSTPDFHNKIEDNRDQLLDLATGALSSKTIADLEKPGESNVIRAELTTIFNNALGGPFVKEIYITEMAIQ